MIVGTGGGIQSAVCGDAPMGPGDGRFYAEFMLQAARSVRSLAPLLGTPAWHPCLAPVLGTTAVQAQPCPD